MNVPTRCRMCLKQCDNDELRSMLTTWNDSINLWTMYDYIMNVGEYVDSTSVPYTCMKCNEDLKSAYDFKVMCVKTERMLSELPKIDPSANESETEYILYDDEDYIEENDEVYEEDYIDVEVEDNWIEEDGIEAVIDAEVRDTSDEDLCSQSVDENIKIVQKTQENIGGEDKKPEDISRKCRVCDIQFENLRAYQAHYRQVHRRTYQRTYHKENPRSCPTCNIRFDDVKLYQVHYRRHHQRPVQQVDNDDPASKVLCPFCGKLLAKKSISKHLQNRHSNNQNKEHPCTICGRNFKWIENLIMHMRIHKNDKRFSCDICGEKFLHWASRRSHIRTKHTGEKNYECQLCGEKFAHSSNMYRHIRRHRNELPHCCSSCSKRFLTKEELKNHQIVHTKEKNEICEICRKCFGTRKNLKAHQKIHSGE